ncbi:MAG: IS21 family transposase, partial [Actinomycetota bacterium]
ALAVGAVDPGAVAVIARHLQDMPEQQPVQLSLVELGELARYERPAPETAGYDVLLQAVTR